MRPADNVAFFVSEGNRHAPQRAAGISASPATAVMRGSGARLASEVISAAAKETTPDVVAAQKRVAGSRPASSPAIIAAVIADMLTGIDPNGANARLTRPGK